MASEINNRGFIIGLIILLISLVPVILLSFMGVAGGEMGIILRSFQNSGLIISWVIIPIMIILAGLSASYLGKYIKLSKAIFAAIVLSIIYLFIIFGLQTFLLPVVTGTGIAEIGAVMEAPLPIEVYYLAVLSSIRPLFLLFLGMFIGVFFNNRNKREMKMPA